MFTLSKRSKERRRGVNSALIEISDLAITLTAIDFGHPEHAGKRSTETQRGLFDKGLSKCDGTMRKSYHQSGNALDFYAYVDGKASWKKEHLAMVACAFLQAASILGYQLEWGGLWKSFKDMPHFQLVEVD